MKSSFPHAPLLRSFELWSRFALDNTAMLWGAGQVIGKRTSQMATHGIAPNERELGEMRRMIEEKQAAVLEGSLAAWREWMRLSQSGWMDAVKLASRNGMALAPVMVGLNPINAVARSTSYAQRATARSMSSATRGWTAQLDNPLRIADAALEPVRTRVASNRKRLGT
jgi:hypothetical protein